MMRGTLTVLSFISVVFFPWLLTILIAVAASFFDPLVPLAAGLFADVLYYTPGTNALVLGTPLPLFTLFGALTTVVAFFVRSRLQTSNMN